jgi:hypothetical protein
MASIFITTTARDTPWHPWAHSNYLRVMRSAQLGHAGPHSLADHPTQADIVLFVEPQRRFQTDIVRSAMYRAYRHKSLVLDFGDNPVPRLPGLYVSLDKRHASSACYRSCSYIRVADNALFDAYEAAHIQPDLLFSFVGSVANCPAVRQRVVRLTHPRATLLDASSKQSDNDPSYLDTLYRSKFVLAPRGHGTSSWRLFETMRAARVPVIISDDWEPPQGVRWPDFSLRIAQADIESLPAILEAMENRAASMGAIARQEWERCFALSSAFQWIASQCTEIRAALSGTAFDSSFFIRTLASAHAAPYLRELLAVAMKAGH